MPPSKAIKERASSNKSLGLNSSRFKNRFAASWANSPLLTSESRTQPALWLSAKRKAV
jgi:hypothetical protein